MPSRKRKPNQDSENLLEDLKDSLENTTQETTEMTSTETDVETGNVEQTEGPQVTVGVTAPKRTRNGAGRTRGNNPFDDLMDDLYQSGEWASVGFSGDKQETEYRNLLKNSAQYKSYGLDMGVDTEEPGVLKFHVRDKVEGRGRKPGSKKIDGHFYSPDELDENGAPTSEARQAKEDTSDD